MRRPMSFEPPDRGSGIVLVILLGGLLGAIGLGLAGLSATERALSGNHQAGVQLLYAAEAIAGRVVQDLSDQAAWSGALAGTSSSSFLDPASLPVTPWAAVLDLPAATSALQATTSPSGAFVWRLFASGTLAALSESTSAPAVYLAAWVADDHADQDGDPAADSNDVIALRAEARGMNALKRAVHVVLQYIPPPPAGEVIPAGPAGVPGVRIVSWREVR
jgi:hypothetical protein